MAKKFTRSALVNPEHTSAVRKVIVGGLLFVVGIGVTIISYQAADHKPGGGVYILGWGAIAFGAFLFIRGLMEIFSD